MYDTDILKLPKVVKAEILIKLDIKELQNACSINNEFNEICNSNGFWHRKINYDFPDFEYEKRNNINYKNFYLNLLKAGDLYNRKNQLIKSGTVINAYINADCYIDIYNDLYSTINFFENDSGFLDIEDMNENIVFEKITENVLDICVYDDFGLLLKTNGDLYSWDIKSKSNSKLDIKLHGKTLNFEDSNVKSIIYTESQFLYLKENGDLYRLMYSVIRKKNAEKVKIIASSVKKAIIDEQTNDIFYIKESGDLYKGNNIIMKNITDVSTGVNRLCIVQNGKLYSFYFEGEHKILKVKDIKKKDKHLVYHENKITHVTDDNGYYGCFVLDDHFNMYRLKEEDNNDSLNQKKIGIIKIGEKFYIKNEKLANYLYNIGVKNISSLKNTLVKTNDNLDDNSYENLDDNSHENSYSDSQ